MNGAPTGLRDKLPITQTLSHPTPNLKIEAASSSKLSNTQQTCCTSVVSILFSNAFIMFHTHFRHRAGKQILGIFSQGFSPLWFVLHLVLMTWIQPHVGVRVHTNGLPVAWHKQSQNPILLQCSEIKHRVLLYTDKKISVNSVYVVSPDFLYWNGYKFFAQVVPDPWKRKYVHWL